MNPVLSAPRPRRLLPLLVLLVLVPVAAAAEEARVRVEKVPDGGIQPQALVDAKGTLHLLAFKGRPEAGDLFYFRRAAGQRRFAKPLRINSQPGSAIAIGSVRGGQMALGRGGRVHVVWNGSNTARPRGPENGSPLLYSRLNDDGTAFEPQRNLITSTRYLDGGGTVAADDDGNVYAAWHGKGPDAANGEAGRAVWVARSSDEGKTFAREEPAWTKATGACGCCGMKGFADRKGNLYLLYRSATERVHRDGYLLTSKDHGKRFTGVRLDGWETSTCPMSTEAFVEGKTGVLAAWETEGQVSFARVDPGTFAVGKIHTPPGEGRKRKHPALAVNDRGEVLLAWTEGTGWQKGGTLVWQVFDRDGRPTAVKGRLDGGIPVWGLPAVVAGPDGFVIFH